jgi:hypothetical protein
VPRAVNNLCETALTVATLNGLPRVTAELVANVAVELLGLDAPPQAATCAPLGPDAQPQAARTPLAGQLQAGITNAAPAVGAAPCETPPASDELPVLTDAIDAAPGSGVAPPAFVRETALPGTQAAAPEQPLEPAAAPPAATAAIESARLAAVGTAPATPALQGVSEATTGTTLDDPDLDMLSSALASAGWTDKDEDGDWIEQLVRTTVDEAATAETPRGAFAAFARRREPALSLVDDSAAADRPKAAAKR